MSNFTDQEIQDAVERLVQNTIRRPYDTLGVRRNDVSFTDIQQAAAGVFLLYQKSPFYCISLGSQSVTQTVQSEANTILDLLNAIRETGRRVLPVNDVSTLFNAKAALESLGQAASERTQGFKDITAVPAYQRFQTNVDRFLNSSGQAVKENGSIARTPQEARQLLPTLVTNLKLSHEKVIQSVKDLANGADDYAALNLSGIVAQSVINNATDVLGAHADELLGLQPEERLAKIRAVVLDLLAAKAAVRTFGSFGGATSTFALNGVGLPYSDAKHLASPASRVAEVPGPYNMQSGSNVLDFYLNGYGLNPRTLTTAIDVVALGNNQAQFDVASIPVDVLTGDIIYVRSGPNNGAKFTILTLVGTVITAQGLVPAFNDAGPVTIEVLPLPSATISLPYAYSATLLGTQREQFYATGTGFIVGDGVNPIRPDGFPPPNNNHVKLNISGVLYDVTLTNSPDGVAGIPGTEATPRTAAEICTDINAVITAAGFTAEPYFNPRKFFGFVSETSLGGFSAQFDLLGGFGNFGNLSIVIGDQINVVDGDGTQVGLWTITAVNPTNLVADMVLGNPSINQSQITIEVGPSFKAIRIKAINPKLAVDNEDTIFVIDDLGVASAGAQMLGLGPGITTRSRPQTAKDIASALNSSSTLISATTKILPVSVGVKARSEPTDSTKIVFSKLRTTTSAGTTWSSPNLVIAVNGALTAGVAPGNLVVERSGAFPGTVYQVLTVSDTVVVAAYVSGTGSSQASVDLEFGDDPTAITEWQMLRVNDGPNRADYYAKSVSGLDVFLNGFIPLPSNPTTLQAETFTLDWGDESVVIASANKTTLSWLKVRGNAESEFVTDDNGVAGTTTYFRLPANVVGLQTNDLVQFYATQYNSPSATRIIAAIEDDILTLDESIPSNVSWVFGASATVPFARLHVGHTFDFDGFQKRLLNWLARSTQQAAYFTDLNRFINPLISNSSPTSVQVGDATNKVIELLKNLTTAGATQFGGTDPLETILKSYQVDHIAPVDALIRTFNDKGADRAVDLLLAGRFSDFFILTMDESSYAGTMQKAMRDVVTADLPMRKINRKDVQTSRVLSSTTTPDPDYNLSDTEVAVPDPPGQGEF